MTGISIIDPNDIHNIYPITVENKEEFNLVDDDLVNYDFEGFEFQIDNKDFKNHKLLRNNRECKNFTFYIVTDFSNLYYYLIKIYNILNLY